MMNMKNQDFTYVYIDGANLHQWSKTWWGINYKKYKQRLHDKYKVKSVFLFLWYVKGNELLYSQLSQLWYILIFKETLEIQGKIKWNCDAELVVKAVSSLYEDKTTQAILITGDGDFACLLDFYLERKHKVILLAPNKSFCSYLLKKRNAPIVILEDIKHKFQ